MSNRSRISDKYGKLVETAAIISAAESSVIMSDPHLSHHVFEHDLVRLAFGLAIRRGVEFRILTGPIDPETTSIIPILQNSIWVVPVAPPMTFIVADEMHVRLGDLNEPEFEPNACFANRSVIQTRLQLRRLQSELFGNYSLLSDLFGQG